MSFRVVEAYTYKRIAEEGIWPEDIRWVKDKLKLRRGAPRWIILDREKIVLHSRRWTKMVWPRLQEVAAAIQPQG